MATKRASQNLKYVISEIAEKLTSIHNKAVAAYTPIVNDICNRNRQKTKLTNCLLIYLIL